MSEFALLFASAVASAATNAIHWTRRGPVRRILVVKVDHLGDVITATPALRALRDAHPDAEIDLLLSPAVAPLFEGSPLATGILTYDSPRFRRSAPFGELYDRPASVRRALAGRRYDAIIELRGDWSTLALPLQVGARKRYDRGTVRLRDWISRRLGSRGAPLHEVETNYEVVKPLLGPGASPEPPPTEVHIAPEARTAIAKRLAENGVDPLRPLVSIHPGAAWRPRAWFPERFGAIADWVTAHYHAQIVVVGSEGERDVGAAVSGHAAGSRPLSLFGTLSLPELAALLERSRLLIGNDSGIAHLATACGTPTVALFGPQDPRRFRPWSDRSIALHHPVPCFPCAQVRCVHPELPCVNFIEIGEVEAAARSLLGPNPLHP